MAKVIPALQNYPTVVKVSASLTVIFLAATIILALYYKPSSVQSTQKSAPPVAQTPPSAKKTPQTQPAKKMKQTPEPQRVEVNTNTGTNNGNIGGSNNTVNNINVGIQPRILNANELTPFLTQYPDTNTRISFRAFNGTDAEMNNFKRLITNWLRDQGYRNIDEDWFLTYGPGEPRFVNIVPSTGGGVTFQIPHQ